MSTYSFWVNPSYDMSAIKDSMQIDSGEIIATLTKGDLKVTFEVVGDVKVEFRGDIFRTPSDFPTELKDLILTDELYFINNAVQIHNNNWFEAFMEGPNYFDSVVVDLEKASIGDLFSQALELMEFLENEERRTCA